MARIAVEELRAACEAILGQIEQSAGAEIVVERVSYWHTLSDRAFEVYAEQPLGLGDLD